MIFVFGGCKWFFEYKLYVLCKVIEFLIYVRCVLVEEWWVELCSSGYFEILYLLI